MRSKIQILGLCLFVIATMAVSLLPNTLISSNDINLNTLEQAMAATESGGGKLECRCVECPREDYGCLSYNYSNPECGGTNSGYAGASLCAGKGPGYIEEHVITCNGSSKCK